MALHPEMEKLRDKIREMLDLSGMSNRGITVFLYDLVSDYEMLAADEESVGDE